MPDVRNETQYRLIIENEKLHTAQKIHAIWITNLIPLLGFLAALGYAFTVGIGWLEVGLFFSMYLITVIGLEVGFHRYFTHRSFETHRIIKAYFAISGSMCAQGPLIYWVANHRRHHRFSDKEGDPHSPYINRKGESIKNFISGLWHAHISWQMDHDTPSTVQLAKDLLKDRQTFFFNKTYFLWVALGILIPALAGGLITMSWEGWVAGILWGGLARIFILNQFTFSINSICHMFGRQPFKTREESRNNFWLAIPSFGQAWHNNHHAFPYAAQLDFEWWQIDLGGRVVALLKWLGLASQVKKPTRDHIQSKIRSQDL